MTGKEKPLTFDNDANLGMAPASPRLEPIEESTLAMPPVPIGDSKMQLSNIGGQGDPPPRQGNGAYWLAALASALWIGGMVGVAVAYQNRVGFFDLEGVALGIFILLCLAPIGFVWLAVHAVRQGRAFLAEARRSQDYAERMLEPTAIAAAEAGSAVELIRTQIQQASATAAQARAELVQLRDVLEAETQQLVESARVSTETARAVVESLGRERAEMAGLNGALEAQAGAIAEAIGRHARMVAEASDLAQTQIGEAEAALAARAADLAAAAGSASDAARLAAEDISRQTVRLETATGAVADQIQIAEDTLGQQRAALVAVAHDLRVEQEDMAVQLETQRAQLAEALNDANHGALRLSGLAAESAKSLQGLTDQVSEQFREVAETAQSERDLLGATALQSLGAFSEAAAFERRALEEQTRLAIDALQQASEQVHRNAENTGEAARLKIEQLSEAAFAAGQQADKVFEARVEEARSLIERTASLVDDAGQRSAQRLENAIAESRAALADLERGLGAIEARAARLPQEAEGRAAEIRQALETANEALLETARKAAEETQAIDSAFQERVKRNYEMLSEAVRLMGVIGSGANARAGGPGRPPPPPPPRPVLTPAPAPLSPTPPAPPFAFTPTPPPEPESPPVLRPAPDPDPVEGRERLRLTPPSVEEVDQAIFEPGDQAAVALADEWTWKDLLGAVDQEDDEDESSLAEALIREIENLALDPAALLPRARIDEVMSALDSGNPSAARDSVRRLAPAAIRRLSRRILSDKVLRSQTERFTSSYRSLVREAMAPGSEVTPHSLLSSDAGRAYLLLDAAVGDLG